MISLKVTEPTRQKIESNLTINLESNVIGVTLQFSYETILDKEESRRSTADSELGIRRTSVINFKNEIVI